MNRVYTDERIPGIEVHNDGGRRFTVYERDAGGQLQEIDSFLTYSEHPNGTIDDATAQRRATDYFNRMAKGTMNAELATRPQEEPLPGNPDRDHTEIVNNPPPAKPEGPHGLSQAKSLDDMLGGNIMTADDVMNAYDQAKAISDPAQREAALKQVQSMSQQMESSAQELVRRLLS